MHNYRRVLAYSIGVACGVGYIAVLAELFGRLLVPNPVNEWLLDTLSRVGHEVAYRMAIYTHDLVVYIVVAVPFAVVLSFLPPRNSWKYLFVALATSLLLQYWPIVDPSVLALLGDLWQFYVGLGISMFSLPIAFAAILAFKKRCRSSTTEDIRGVSFM